MKKDKLIQELVNDFKPYKPVWPALQVSLLWFLSILAIGIALSWFTGAFRENLITELSLSARFLLEVVLFFSISFLLVWQIIGSSIPGYKTKLVSVYSLLTALTLTVLICYSFSNPSLAVSMEGKRHSCFYEIMGVGVLISISLLMILRRRVIVNRIITGLISGVTSALLIAGFMHVACMYDPTHLLSYHLLPVPIVGIVSAALSYSFIKTP